jgi:PAS domain S-box-containing protein
MVSSTKSQLSGQRLCELFPINRTSGFFEKYVHVVESGEPLDEEFTISAPYVQASWLHHQVIPLGDGIAITSHDITQRKQDEQRLRESELRKAAIVETALDCIISIDHSGHVTEFNPAAERTFGYSRQHAIGQLLHELIVPPELREAHCRGIRHYLETGEGPILNNRLELPAVRSDGSRIAVELAVTSIPGQNPPAFTAYLRDITQRTEDAKALQAAKEEAEHANRAKSEFLSRMSHELRTPLNAILGFGQLLEMDELDALQSESVEQIMQAGQHLLGLINEVLDLSRIEAGRMELSLEPIDISEVVCEAVDLVRPIAVRENTVLHDATAGYTGYVMADRQRLKQVLLNLLTNAVKYNRPQGNVTVSCAVESNQRLRILVRDSGYGISAQQIERLFLPFERLGAEHSGIEGTGLGLALSQRLVQAMDSTIEVASTQGEGSTFSFALPIVAEAQETTPFPIYSRTKRPTAAPNFVAQCYILRTIFPTCASWSASSKSAPA